MDVKNVIKICITALLIAILSACVPTKEEKFARNQSRANASEDPVMVNAILGISKNSKYKANIGARHISLKIYNNLYENQISGAVNSYRKNDSSNDQVAKTYIATAKKRGNRVAMYNSKVNKAILSLYNQGTRLKGDVWYYDLDNALVEYDKKNRIVSALVRINEFMIPIGNVLHEQRSNFYLSSDARYIESKISKKALEDNFIANL